MELGGENIHPDYLLPKLTSRQLAEWEEYFKDVPFGQDVSDRMIARVLAALHNRWRQKGTEPVKPDELVPKFRSQTVEEMKFALRRQLAHL